MPSTTFYPFSRLPTELRNKIWHYSMLTFTTIHFREGADLDVTSISPPPGQQLANKEARQAYLSQGFKPYSIYTVEDLEDIHVNEETTIQLIAEPSKNPKANLNITWTELQVVLHDALPIVKKLHIVCSKPERLVRLWMLPEGGLVRVGQTHFDEDLFSPEVLSSDRKYRESLHTSLLVTTSAATLEEIAQGSEEDVKTWELDDEKILEGFRPKANVSTTKAFKLVGEEENKSVEQWEESGIVNGEQVRGEGDALTEEAIEKFVRETGWTPRSSMPSSIYSGDVYYDGELWLTVP